MKTLWLLAALASASSVKTAPAPRVNLSVPAISVQAPAFLGASALKPALSPTALSPRPLSAPVVSPTPSAVAVPVEAKAPFAQRVDALASGVQASVDAIKAPDLSGAGAFSAGRSLEDALTGAKGLSAPDEAQASPEELSFAAQTVNRLAARADDLGEERKQKAKNMTGSQFAGLIGDAAALLEKEEKAPTPAAAKAASAVRAALVRTAFALLPAAEPALPNMPRLLAVWQVFGAEMERAAEQKTLSAIVADAELFAAQVEDSVPKPDALKLLPSQPSPEDPDGYNQVSIPGSIFDWKPIEKSPGHGFAPLDALIRWALKEKKSPYAKGFELSGAKSREEARVRFYGERHTDGGLIEANMDRIIADAKPGGKLIILVEGYVGWDMHGYQAMEYLEKRGFDRAAMAAKGINSADVEVRGWDTRDAYDASKHPLLQHHMDLLELNRLAYSEERGWAYYKRMAKAAWAAFQGWRELWQLALVARNKDLDAAAAKAAADADKSGATVHIIAGTDHLMQNPRLNDFLPWLFRPSFRKSLEAALGGRPFWASQPANTIP